MPVIWTGVSTNRRKWLTTESFIGSLFLFFGGFLFYEKEQDEEEDKVVKAVASVGEQQDQGEDEKLLRADAAVLAEKRAEPQTKSSL